MNEIKETERLDLKPTDLKNETLQRRSTESHLVYLTNSEVFVCFMQFWIEFLSLRFKGLR